MGVEICFMNSLDFVKNRIASGMTNGMEHNKYDVFGKLPSYILPNILESMGIKQEGNDYKYKIANNIDVTLSYNPDTDFEYFTMKRCICDGTIAFIEDLIIDCIENVVYIKTVNKEKITDNFLDFGHKHDIHYTIGDFIFGSEHDEKFAPDDKRWMQDRFTIFLPIKFEYKLKE